MQNANLQQGHQGVHTKRRNEFFGCPYKGCKLTFCKSCPSISSTEVHCTTLTKQTLPPKYQRYGKLEIEGKLDNEMAKLKPKLEEIIDTLKNYKKYKRN